MSDPYRNHHSRPYGVGLAYRYVIHEDAMKHQDSIDLLELPTEDYIIYSRKKNSDPDEALLKEAMQTFPCVAHGISLSIGTVEPLDANYIYDTKQFLEDHELEVFSEHLAFHRMDHRDLTLFLAMPFEEVAVQWVKRNYNTIRQALGRPFALENVTYFFSVPKSSLSEADFLRRITEETDCSLLLDVTNVYNNAHNHGYDPYEFIDRLPLDRVSQLHLAGGRFVEGKWEDSHSNPVMDPVWDLYEEVVKRSAAEIVIVERDSRFNPFSEVLADVERAREIFYKHKPQKPEGEWHSKVFPAEEEVNLDAGYTEPEFADLRGFQLGVMGRITNEEFREAYYKDPDKAMEPIPMSNDWRERVHECHDPSMDKLERTWDAIQEQERIAKAREEKKEWAAWADVLKQETT